MFQTLLEKLALALEKRSIDYMVIGGQALLLYGEPRLTKDIDVTLGAGNDQLAQIVELAKSLEWKSLVDSPAEFVKQTMVFPCIDPASGIRIDFIFSFSLYEKQAIERARKIVIGKAQVRFASVEDLIIHKIIAGRPRDLEDVKTVVLKNSNINIDANYIRHWLKQFEQALSHPFAERFETIWKGKSSYSS